MLYIITIIIIFYLMTAQDKRLLGRMMGSSLSNYDWYQWQFVIPLRFNLLYRNAAGYSGKKVDLGLHPGSVVNSTVLGNLIEAVSSIKK